MGTEAQETDKEDHGRGEILQPAQVDRHPIYKYGVLTASMQNRKEAQKYPNQAARIEINGIAIGRRVFRLAGEILLLGSTTTPSDGIGMAACFSFKTKPGG